MAEQPLIEARNVSKKFRLPTAHKSTLRDQILGFLQRRPPNKLNVLEDVSLEVWRGESLGIMGRNGGGKSTLLKILCGIYEADSGSVAVRAPVMPVLELGLGWNMELDAIDNVVVIATLMGMTLRDARSSIEEILAFAELEKFANQQLRYFSSGMLARLGYAVAFQAVREVLVLDEIFAVGDAGFRARCEERYRQLIADGYTVVMVSHAPETVATYCTRAVLLDGGRIAMNDSGANVAAAYLGVTGGGAAAALAH